MARYSEETKEQMVRKMMPPHNRSVASIHRETGISAPTLYAWKRQFQEHGYVIAKKAGPPAGWDGKARLAALIRTIPMNEAERSAWCREHGVYPEQLDDWRAAIEAADDDPASRRELACERKTWGQVLFCHIFRHRLPAWPDRCESNLLAPCTT